MLKMVWERQTSDLKSNHLISKDEDIARDEIVYSKIWSEEEHLNPSSTVSEMLKKLKLLGGKVSILDIGCGIGRHITPAEELDFEIIRLDRNSLAVAKAIARSIKATTKIFNTDGRNWIKQCNSIFDGVILFDVLHHLGTDEFELNMFLSDLRKLIRKDGYIIVSFLSDITYGAGMPPHNRCLRTAKEASNFLDKNFHDFELLIQNQKKI